MALLINQGVQDTSQDNKFNPIVCKDALLQITELKLSQSAKNTIEVTFRIISGQFKNRFVFDRVQYQKTPEFDMTWRYRSLRACAGVPYSETEKQNIDIEALLLNKAVFADLGIRKGKNKDGEDQEYQSITYKKRKEEEVVVAPSEEQVQTTINTANTTSQKQVAKPTVKVKQAKVEKEVEIDMSVEETIMPNTMPVAEPEKVSTISVENTDTSVPTTEDEDEWA